MTVSVPGFGSVTIDFSDMGIWEDILGFFKRGSK
jgi:hypothetical protein